MLLRKVSCYFFFCALGYSFLSVVLASKTSKTEPPTIAIFGSIPYQLVEECRKSCELSLRRFGEEHTIVYMNAAGSSSTAKKIARYLHNATNIVAIVTLDPLTTSLMSQIETKKPLIYTMSPQSSTLCKQANLYAFEMQLPFCTIAHGNTEVPLITLPTIPRKLPLIFGLSPTELTTCLTCRCTLRASGEQLAIVLRDLLISQ